MPCLVRWPDRILEGAVSDAFLTSLEIVPTFAATAKFPLAKNIVFNGFDMLPVIQGVPPSPGNEMFWKRRNHAAVPVGQWKWMDMPDRGGGLFDLATDPGEKRDISLERPEILQQLKERFHIWEQAMEEADPRGPFRDF